jgi:RNA polymerase sigma-70 factor (ECF subfamily)
MARVALGDADAFRSLVDFHGSVPHRIAWRMTGDADEAEEIAQESLLRLWENASAWQGNRPGVAAWLTRVAMNLSLDRLRKRRFTIDRESDDRVDDSPLADSEIDSRRLAETTRDCVAALSDRQRAAIVLTYYEDLPNQVAAEHLEMNIKAFESLLLRARRTLRSLLESRGVLGVSVGEAT